MGVSTKDQVVLKLVYPGRHVEILTQPITAAEIMRKNPRHCVTRPDFFKFPGIVVRPESVLLPGRVFYVVPNRTVYQVLKDKGLLQKQLVENLSPNNTDDPRHGVRQEITALNSMAGRTPMYQHNGQPIQNHFKNDPRRRHISQNEDYNKLHIKRSHVKPYPEMQLTRRPYQDSNHGSTSFSSNQVRPFERFTNNNQLSSSYGGGGRVRLKSCLRKPESYRRLLNLRVTFSSPVEIARNLTESPSLQ